MPFSQLPAPTSGELGAWLVGLACCLAVLHLGLQVWDRLKGKPLFLESANDVTTITQAALDRAMAKVDRELVAVEARLNTRMTTLEGYAHERYHALADHLNAIGMQVTELAVLIKPLAERLERLGEVDSRLAVLTDRLDQYLTRRGSNG